MKSNGPGKYDEACTYVRELLDAEGVILMVFGGCKGNGFEVQAPPSLITVLPTILRQLSDDIDADNEKNADT